MTRLHQLVTAAGKRAQRNPFFRLFMSDRFDGQGAVPPSRSATPGPGRTVAVDSGGVLSLDDGLVFTGGEFVWNTPHLRWDGFVERGHRQALAYEITPTGTGSSLIGLFTEDWRKEDAGHISSGIGLYHTVTFGDDTSVHVYAENAYAGAYGSIATLPKGQAGKFAVVPRPDGGAYFFGDGPGFTNRLLWVDRRGENLLMKPRSQARILQPRVVHLNATVTLNSWEVGEVDSFYGDDWEMVTGRAVSPVADTTVAAEADALAEVYWTPVADSVFTFDVRRIDDDNRWTVRIDQAAPSITLYEITGGVETVRATSTADTWQPTDAHGRGLPRRILVILDGSSIGVWVPPVNGIAHMQQRLQYTSTQHSAATTVRVDACEEVCTWPRHVTFPVLQESSEATIRAATPIRPTSSVETEPVTGESLLLTTSSGAVLHFYKWSPVPGHVGGLGRVMFRRTDDGGATWTDPVILYADPDDRHCGGIAGGITPTGRVYLTWSADSPPPRELLAVYSDDDGVNWSTPAVITHPDRSVARMFYPCVGQWNPEIEQNMLCGYVRQGVIEVRRSPDGMSWPASGSTRPTDQWDMGVGYMSNVNECSMAYVGDGLMVMLLRQEASWSSDQGEGCVLQSVSTDNGVTWSQPESTNMPYPFMGFAPHIRYDAALGKLVVFVSDRRSHVTWNGGYREREAAYVFTAAPAAIVADPLAWDKKVEIPRPAPHRPSGLSFYGYVSGTRLPSGDYLCMCTERWNVDGVEHSNLWQFTVPYFRLAA